MSKTSPGDPCHARGGDDIRGSAMSNRQLKKNRQRLAAKMDRRNEYGNQDLTPHNVTRRSITYR